MYTIPNWPESSRARWPWIDRYQAQRHETREKYNITGIPATLIFKDGELAGIVQGNKDKETIVARLKEIEPNLEHQQCSPPSRSSPS